MVIAESRGHVFLGVFQFTCTGRADVHSTGFIIAMPKYRLSKFDKKIWIKCLSVLIPQNVHIPVQLLRGSAELQELMSKTGKKLFLENTSSFAHCTLSDTVQCCCFLNTDTISVKAVAWTHGFTVVSYNDNISNNIFIFHSSIFSRCWRSTDLPGIRGKNHRKEFWDRPPLDLIMAHSSYCERLSKENTKEPWSMCHRWDRHGWLAPHQF